MKYRGKSYHAWLLSSAAATAIMWAGSASAEDAQFNIAPQPLASALNEFSLQSKQSVLFTTDLAAAKSSQGVNGQVEVADALSSLLAGTGLTYRRNGNTFLIVSASDPQSGSAAGDGAGTVEALIVTAQKREENIQDVPIAMSAFTQEDLTRSQVAGGPDLMTQIPNMTFTKTNFSSYSIQIRGIGTQAISATTDPAVAVAFNNTPFIRNRFFEQEFYDLQRVEVLRGPQGTLYGRNATAGVVNIISAKPKFSYEAKLSGDVGNYRSTRLEGMVNIPLVENKVALRLAGAWTKRDGYAFNQMTGSQIDGRDLWSTRLSLRFEPTDWISANLIWEHFEENDDRLRSGKQLCKKDVVTEVGGLPIPDGTGSAQSTAAYLAQGCTAVSLYSPEAFQTPNENSLPYFYPLNDIGLPLRSNAKPYLNATQSPDLRTIESSVEPDYRAKSDVAELQISIDLPGSLTLTSETAYNTDSLFSLQDYNRFTTAGGIFDPTRQPNYIDENGVYCDPQLGCSDRLLLVDLSTSDSTQFSQEFRLGSDFDGPLNFSLGANYLRHDAYDKYYVFINTISMWSAMTTGNGNSGGGPCSRGHASGELAPFGTLGGVHGVTCPYMDPNPIGSLNDMGRNYFLSKNPYKLVSYAAFGELYYNILPDLKLTAGARFTVDHKTAPQIPSWLLAGPEDGPYPTLQTISQEWREPTGRLALDWTPTLSFTDQTLLYTSFAHGYKAGGANPPPPVFATYGGADSLGQEILPDTFGPEFVNAFEVGTKNTLLDGGPTLNLTGFYYDYTGYQTSEIRNRSAVNSNFDAKVWGAELEAEWRISEALRLGFKGGYEKTRMADGSSAIDLMDRTAGRTDWMVVRPFPTIPSNCILPVYELTAGGTEIHAGFPAAGRTTWNGDCIDAYYNHLDPITRLPYVANPTVWKPSSGVISPLPAKYAGYPGFDPLAGTPGDPYTGQNTFNGHDYGPVPNGGRGFSKDLSGNELPNAPNFTATVTADYTMPLAHDWLLTFHGDYHWQSKSWWRVFNDLEYDRLKAFSTVNVSAIFSNDDAGWKVMAYVKNVFDETAITGAFLNSDDTGLTTNVFLTEPRLYGLRVTKDWTGSVFGWSGHEGNSANRMHPLWVEIGGGVGRFGKEADRYEPAWVTPALSSSLTAQDHDLDWGDMRSIKVAYRPLGGWRVSADYLYGKTNGHGREAAYQNVPGASTQSFGGTLYVDQIDNYAIASAQQSEEFEIADFKVGKDFGLGMLGAGSESQAVVGLRYASFKSTDIVGTNGIAGSYIVASPTSSTGVRSHNHYAATLHSEREFDGAGPSLSWDGSIRLAGSETDGHADLDWSLGGAALFGRQTTESVEDRVGTNWRSTNPAFANPVTLQKYTATTLYNTATPRRRTQRVTVPNLSLALGLSYTVDRVKVSTGYSYDRFFNAIDGGVAEAKQYDRTIQGPYFKIAVGFGG